MGHYDKQREAVQNVKKRIAMDKEGSVTIEETDDFYQDKEATSKPTSEEIGRQLDKFVEDLQLARRDLTKTPRHTLWVSEFDDFYRVLEMGAEKHGSFNWLDPNGSKSSHKDMCDSMFHHLAEAYTGKLEDDESGMNPLLHLISRAMMLYTRQKRGLVHSGDIDIEFDHILKRLGD